MLSLFEMGRIFLFGREVRGSQQSCGVNLARVALMGGNGLF